VASRHTSQNLLEPLSVCVETAFFTTSRSLARRVADVRHHASRTYRVNRVGDQNCGTDLDDDD